MIAGQLNNVGGRKKKGEGVCIFSLICHTIHVVRMSLLHGDARFVGGIIIIVISSRTLG